MTPEALDSLSKRELIALVSTPSTKTRQGSFAVEMAASRALAT
jgi:hypothetical protein